MSVNQEPHLNLQPACFVPNRVEANGVIVVNVALGMIGVTVLILVGVLRFLPSLLCGYGLGPTFVLGNFAVPALPVPALFT